MPHDTLPDADWPRIPGYRIERRLGRGGMATVWLATQDALERRVAIKVMALDGGADDDTLARRFEHEARLIARLEHPGIVGIHAVGRLEDGRPYYVMPFLPNGDLSARALQDDERTILALLRAVLDALDYAHARGIVHRDVKPENVLFDEADRPRLADFGIALAARAEDGRITREGMALGSGGYMAPEQARGDAVDARADLYSLGVMAYELLVGEPPFRADEALALALMHAYDPIPRLPPRWAHWQRLIDRAMAKEPDRRFQSAAQMARALDRLAHRLDHPGHAALHWLQDAAAQWPRWRQPALRLGAGLLIGAAAALLLWPRGESPATTDGAPPPGDAAAGAQQAIAQRLQAAAEQLDRGALVEPPGDSAADHVLAVLRADPAEPRAARMLGQIFDALGARAARAIRAGLDEDAARALAQASQLAIGSGGRDGTDAAGVRAAAAAAFDAQLDTLLADGHADSARALPERMRALGLDPAPLSARLAALQPAGPGDRVRDPGGPALRWLPSAIRRGGMQRRLERPLALMEVPVSVGDYRRFADATARAPARCRARLSPLRLADARDWRDPGHAQSDASPVVCISHADAVAYAAWLSSRTGARYRLPSAHERELAILAARGGQAAVAGATISEWTADCSDAGCSRRITLDAGADGRRLPALRERREADRGFDGTGLRLVREIDPDQPPPAA